jgi:hypothetical protein
MWPGLLKEYQSFAMLKFAACLVCGQCVGPRSTLIETQISFNLIITGNRGNGGMPISHINVGTLFGTVVEIPGSA